MLLSSSAEEGNIGEKPPMSTDQKKKGTNTENETRRGGGIPLMPPITLQGPLSKQKRGTK